MTAVQGLLEAATTPAAVVTDDGGLSARPAAA